MYTFGGTFVARDKCIPVLHMYMRDKHVCGKKPICLSLETNQSSVLARICDPSGAGVWPQGGSHEVGCVRTYVPVRKKCIVITLQTKYVTQKYVLM